MKPELAKISMLALALATLDCGAAHAQAAAEEPAPQPSDIVVTARRVEERLQDVPISITVFNQDQLAARNIVNSADLATYTPSLAINSRYGTEKASFSIRGFSQDLNTLPTVAVYFADAVAPRLSSNLTSGNGAGVGSMFDLQNVQVLKGPQGTLFGRNTTGGAILLVPQRPTGRLEGYVEGTVGNYDERRVEAVLNLPLSDTFKVRMGIDRNVRDGYLHNRSGVGPADFNNLDYFAGRLSILGELTPDLENYLIFTYSHSRPNGTIGKIAYCNRGTVAGSVGSTALVRAAQCGQFDAEARQGYGFYDVENSDPYSFVRQTQWQVINTTTLAASDTLTIKNIASYGEAKESYSANISGDNTAIPFVLTYPGKNQGQGNQWTMTEELQFQGHSADNRVTWQGGGYMELSEPNGGQTQYSTTFAACSDVYAFKCTPLTTVVNGSIVPVGSVSQSKNLYHYQDFALYAQATYKVTDQLSLTAGLRYTWDWERSDADNVRVVPSPNGPLSIKCSRAPTPANADLGLLYSGACGIGRSFVQKSQRPTWLVDLDYKPSEDVLLYAKYARGYRGGGINESNVGAETWRPESLDDYEVGAKIGFNGPVRGTINLDGFWNEFRDQQASVFIPACTAANAGCTNPPAQGINGIQNVGRSRIRGIEADGTLFVLPSLHLDFGYAYLDAKATGASAGFCDTTRFICSLATTLSPGTVLPLSPRNRFTVTGTYTLPLDESIGRISIGATFTHTDSQVFTHSNDSAFAVGAVPFNAGVNPATDLFNLNLSWKNIGGKPIDLALFATNVTNQKYWVAAVNGLSSIGSEYIMLGEPRMYGARLKVRLGQ